MRARHIRELFFATRTPTNVCGFPCTRLPICFFCCSPFSLRAIRPPWTQINGVVSWRSLLGLAGMLFGNSICMKEGINCARPKKGRKQKTIVSAVFSHGETSIFMYVLLVSSEIAWHVCVGDDDDDRVEESGRCKGLRIELIKSLNGSGSVMLIYLIAC